MEVEFVKGVEMGMVKDITEGYDDRSVLLHPLHNKLHPPKQDPLKMLSSISSFSDNVILGIQMTGLWWCSCSVYIQKSEH